MICCICPISKKGKRRMSRVYLEEDNVPIPILEARKMKTKDKTIYN